MTETDMGFLLENMLQLINSDNELILKAYEERVVDKEHIKLLYVDMQFLLKFLKDSEGKRDEHKKLKSLVAKIREVSCRAEDILDWFVLNVVLQRDGNITDDFPLYFSSSKSIVHLVRKISDCLKPLMTDIASMKKCKREMMDILSRFESHMAGEIHPYLYEDVVEDIKFMISIIKEAVEIHEKGSSLRWFELSPEVNCLNGLYHKVRFEAEMLYRSEIIHNCSDHAREYFNPKEAQVMDCWKGLRLTIFLSRDYYLLFRRLEEMVDMAKKICHALPGVTKEIKLIKTKVTKIYERGSSDTWLNSLVTHEFSYFLSLSEEMLDLGEKNFRSFDGVIEEIKPIMIEVMNINQKGLRLSWLESLVADQFRQGFGIITKEIESTKREVMLIYKKMHGIGVSKIRKSSHGALSKPTSSIVNEDIVVGFDDETTMVIELLTGEYAKTLKVIAIIGMPGLDIQLRGKFDGMSEEELGEGLYKSLKAKKYLIVIDDIWELKAWNGLKRYFPNDNNGSRIIFTSRQRAVAVALHAQPHCLRFLNPDESWDLLRHKTFRGESYPPELEEIGKEIAKKCQGLPLAILVIAGVLAKKDKVKYWWRQVAESVSSYIVTDPEQCMDTLALSYDHLPCHLKPCFLYFGAFVEDSEISVWKLIALWIAEGFIPRNQPKSLEEVAEDFMMDLIDRSLVIVSKKNSNGGIKACRVHDLLRDLCLRKAKEENFLSIFRGMDPNAFFNAKMSRRICINPHFQYLASHAHHKVDISVHSNHATEIRSFSSTLKLSESFVSSFCGVFKLLRVLNISFIKISSLPEELQLLVHLRYLSFYVEEQYFQPLISNLCKLETFIVEGGPTGWLSFSYDIWKMVKLRHLYTKRFIEIPYVFNDDHQFVLDDLQTISKLDLCGLGEQALRWIPNLKKLTCSFMESLGGDNIFPKLNFLIHLETLNVSYGGFRGHLGKFPHLNEFPPNLKSLTLSNFRLPWEEMSTLGSLPNLEVLKLSNKAFEGPRWETSDGQFRKLKFLKFQRLDIKQWNACSNHFPSLQILVWDDCKQFEEIPYGLGEIFTLEMIRLWYCSSSAACSVRQIQKQQRSMGYDGLKILIHPGNNFDNNEDDEDDSS
ncbi:putative late blight resistance protein homolog R1B-16 isoform X2 [Cornus florida]|uniref:putative late blight resistance protein homolog R1B-16 isoform X2 n=1 Tax=Cornus florida TaxID=4283 RepID=UPI0028998C22|nr:putative late blight resistance protein homolog R1B-16 isoform X2 [Cornus florida]